MPVENVCRILSNVHYLSERIDVPTLYAIMFLHPCNSQVEVIQAKSESVRHTIGTTKSKSHRAYGEQRELSLSSRFVDFIKAIFLKSFEITDYWES